MPPKSNKNIQNLQFGKSDSQQVIESDILILFNEGVTCHQHGQVSKARGFYEQVLVKQPLHFGALQLLGILSAQSKNLSLAVELFNKAISVNPKIPDVFYNRGVALQELNCLQDAVSSYDKAIDIKPDYAEAFSNRGDCLRELRRFEEAVDSYEKAIAVRYDYPEALSNRGIALCDLKRAEEAVGSFDKAIAIRPDYAEAYSNRGNALKELKRLDEAVASYDKAIAIRPDYAEAYSNRGNALKELKRLEEAVASYDKAIVLNPNYADAHSNRGIALFELKRIEEAIASYSKAIAIKPSNGEVHFNLGIALLEFRAIEDALASFDRVISVNVDYAEAYLNRGVALHDLNQLEQALASYDKAIAIRPDYAEAYSNRGNALKELKRLDEAVASYDKAIAIRPDYAEAYSNRGNALKELKRLEEAVASYDKAIVLNPNYADAHSNRGVALFELKRIEEAITSYDKAISVMPDYADAYWNKSLALLLNGDFEQGWKLYEWRWKQNKAKIEEFQLIQPVWDGNENIKGKTILLHAEQGIGDSIQFCRYAQLVKDKGARVLFRVPTALAYLLKELSGVDDLIINDQKQPHIDYHCPLLSLPFLFKTELNNIPFPHPYIKVDPIKKQEWEVILGNKKKIRLGVVWSSTSNFKNDHIRSMELKEFIKCIPEGEFEIICLQKEIKNSDLAYFDALGDKLKFYGPCLKDFSDTAALASCLDLVVSTCTSVPHLTAAIGIPTWILVSYVPDFRWLLGRNDSPWYESVRLYRQDESKTWDTALGHVAKDLHNFVTSGKQDKHYL